MFWSTNRLFQNYARTKHGYNDKSTVWVEVDTFNTVFIIENVM